MSVHRRPLIRYDQTDNGSTSTDLLAMLVPSLVAPACLQAEPERQRQLLVSAAYSSSLWPFHTNLAVDHVGAPPTLDKVRSNRQRQHLDRSPGRARAMFGGSSLPAGQARATKATSGLRGLQQFTLAISH